MTVANTAAWNGAGGSPDAGYLALLRLHLKRNNPRLLSLAGTVAAKGSVLDIRVGRVTADDDAPEELARSVRRIAGQIEENVENSQVSGVS